MVGEDKEDIDGLKDGLKSGLKRGSKSGLKDGLKRVAGKGGRKGRAVRWICEELSSNESYGLAAGALVHDVAAVEE